MKPLLQPRGSLPEADAATALGYKNPSPRSRSCRPQAHYP